MFDSKLDRIQGGWLTGEKICLAAPLLMLPLMAWELHLAHAIPYYFAFLVGNAGDGLFGSVGHSGLAWGLLYLTPEGREWWKAHKIRVVAVACVFFAAMLTLFFIDDSRFLTWFLALYISLTFHHSLMQTQGITFAYSHENEPDRSERQRIERLHSKQRYAFGALVFLSCIYPVSELLGWPILTNLQNRIIYFAVGAAVALWLIFSNLTLSGPQKNKMIFLARTFCVPLGAFSVFAANGTRVIHSLEYILIYRKMLSNSESERLFKGFQRVAISLTLYFSFSAIWIFFFLRSTEFTMDYEIVTGLPAPLKVLAALTLTRSLMHYYMDRKIFRMSNPVSRRAFGALLTGGGARVQG